jgi:hypothetical protein
MDIRFGHTQEPEPPPPTPRDPAPPMVYVYESLQWEYRRIARNPRDHGPPSEQELNALGAEGWELAGIANLPGEIYFYFKRPRDR